MFERLALIGRHAQGRIALQVFDRTETLARGKLHVLAGHVVLQVDERLANGVLDAPERTRSDSIVGALPGGHSLRIETCRDGGLSARLAALPERVPQPERSGAGARRAHPARRLTRHEGRESLRPLRLASEVRRQREARVPASGHGQEIHRISRDPPVRGAHRNAREPLPTIRPDDLRVQQHRHVAAFRSPDERRIHLGSRVDHRLHGDARLHEIRGGPPSVVARGEDRGAAPRRHPEPVDVRAHGGSEHDARSVVASEHDGAFHAAGREHALPRDDFPQSLARTMGRRHGKVIADPLERTVGPRAAQAAVVGAEHRRSRHDSNVGHRAQFRFDAPCPIATAEIVDDVTVAVQPSAQDEILIAQDDPRARAPGEKRGGEAGRAAADDQHVAKCVSLVVRVGIGLVAGATESRRPAYQRLIELLPKCGRPHERLVVKTGDENRRQQRIDGPQVEADIRP